MSVVILDRDGVINFDSPDYIKSADEWQPIPGSIDAIVALYLKGFKVCVATNQAGLAKGKFSKADLDAMHSKLESLVTEGGGQLTGIFFCPHHPDEKCGCRKPNTGLLDQIQLATGEDLTGQPFVGDSMKDLQAAVKKGCAPILVRTGNGSDTETRVKQDLGEAANQVMVFDNLASVATYLCR